MTHLVIVNADATGRKEVQDLVTECVNRGWHVDLVSNQPDMNVGSPLVRTHDATDRSHLDDKLTELLGQFHSNFLACGPAAIEAVARVKQKKQQIACAGLQYFSQESDIGTILDRTYDALLLYKWTIGAGLQEGSGRSLILTGERGVKPIGQTTNLTSEFLDVFSSRIDQRHYKTEGQIIAALPEAIARDVAEILPLIREWAGYSLFPKYQNDDPRYPGAEFGFIARRTSAGTLITARGSNKEDPAEVDLALLQNIDATGTLHVVSTKRKASLNAPLAYQIFDARPDINWIVHSHIFLPEGVTVPNISAPGTQNDWAAIQHAVSRGATIINQPLHGTLILLKEPSELLPLLHRNNLYQKRSALYDLAYARFQGTPDKPTHFERNIADLSLNSDAKVLDLCCGTGASTLALQKMGFTNIDFTDGSASMLGEAQKRTGKNGLQVQLGDLSAIPDGAYDLITMRQAFNYIPPDQRDSFVDEIAMKLMPGGQFVFNTFAEQAVGTKPPRDFEHQSTSVLVRTREMNNVTSAEVLHTQRTEIIDFDNGSWDAILDVNSFYQHPASGIEVSLRKAGLDVEIRQDGPSLTFISTRPVGMQPPYTPRAKDPENGLA